jgi:hypothetical protein
MLANFLGVLPILTPPLCALAFIMCSKSNPLVFALDLMSAYEGEHTIFEDSSYWIGSTLEPKSPRFGFHLSFR